MIIEVEPLFNGKRMTEILLEGLPEKAAALHYQLISKKLSGLLCIQHAQLPNVERSYLSGRWVVSIRCCCRNSRENILKRIDEK